MATAFENFQIQDLVARPEDAARLAMLATAEGQRVRGYGGDYFRLALGDAAVIVRAAQDPETGERQLLGMDTHAASDCVWTCEAADDITPPDYDRLQRRLLVTGPSGAVAAVEVVDADVLPDVRPGTPLRLNMVGFPRWIEYLDGEEDYARSLERRGEDEDPALPLGGLFALGLAREDGAESLVLLRGRVTDMKVGETYMGLEPMTTFIRTTVETELGPIELCHTAEMVAADQKDRARVGAEVSALCLLSGDAAVGELIGGVMFDEGQDLALLRSFFERGDAERLRPALNGECRYLSDEAADRVIEGADGVVALLRSVEEAVDAGSCYFAYPAVITGVDAAEGEERPAYGKGKRCLLLAQGGPERYVALCFVELDSLGRIRTLHLSRDGRYSFERMDRP